MYRFKYAESQDKLIAALEEISFLKDLLSKKSQLSDQEGRPALRGLSSLSCQLNIHSRDYIL